MPLVATLVSLGATTALWALLHRLVAPLNPSLDPLLLGSLKSLGTPEWALLLGVAAACVFCIVRRRPSALLLVQACSFGVGMLLMLYHLGNPPGPKVDLRLLLAVNASVASLHASYLCSLAHAAKHFTLRRRPS